MGITLSDGCVNSNLIVTSFSLGLQSSVSQVKAYKSTWFTAKTPNIGTISISFLQGSINAQTATVGLIQKWLKQNALLTFSYPELGIIDWKTYIRSCSYQWKYDTPAPVCSFTMDSVTNWYQNSLASLISDSNVYGLFNGGIVTRDLNQIEGAGQSSTNQNGVGAPSGTSQNQAVVQWIKNKMQFHGIYVQYLKNGNVTIDFSNGNVYSNVKPTYALYQQILNYQSNHEFQGKGETAIISTAQSPQAKALNQMKQAKENGFEKAVGDIENITKWWFPFL
ncbi:MAG: hypothetical protein J6S67_17290 [Methanobrevibacter sp.]|nr:hypothetical protein [Methanobrevibacter sp.]